MESGRTAVISAVGGDGAVLGVVGELARDILSSYGLDLDALAMFEIDLDAVYQSRAMHGDVTSFGSFSRTPDVYRDLSLIANKGQSSDSIRDIMEDHPLVVDATLFDLYEDEAGDGSQRVLGYRLLFQSINNTLTAEQVNLAENEILEALKSKFGISLRS